MQTWSGINPFGSSPDFPRSGTSFLHQSDLSDIIGETVSFLISILF